MLDQVRSFMEIHVPPVSPEPFAGLDVKYRLFCASRIGNSHVITATGVAGLGRVGGRDEARMLCRESGRYLHAAVEVKRPCSGPHLLPLDWLAVAVRSPQLTIKI